MKEYFFEEVDNLTELKAYKRYYFESEANVINWKEFYQDGNDVSLKSITEKEYERSAQVVDSQS